MKRTSFHPLFKRPAPWLAPAGTADDGIAVSTRIRLARNLADAPFPGRADAAARHAAFGRVTDAVAESLPPRGTLYCGEIDRFPPLERLLLLERHLISRELATGGDGSGLLVVGNESLSVLVNEEDHVRIQAMLPGFCPAAVYGLADELDNHLGRRLEFAFDDTLGFLTACPSNAGTGMRASVMLHLPALFLAGQLEAVTRAAGKLQLAVRGPFGEGSEPLGHLLQVSNQATLGESEAGILTRLDTVIRSLIRSEQAARRRLLAHDGTRLRDRVGRAFGTLRFAATLTTREALDQLSLLLLGAGLGLFSRLRAADLRPLLFEIQAGQLQWRTGRELDKDERAVRRAGLVRDRLKALQPLK